MRGCARPESPRPFSDRRGALKLLWLAFCTITATWGKEANFWRSARNQFAIVYGERFTSPPTKCAGAWTLACLRTHRTQPHSTGKPAQHAVSHR